ncbi:MAG: hypothetical protein KTR26_02255 [Flammeovirgaceae bacterium]|nr:hypothetical protein [Flammeovirgaceae bacterium]
MDNIEKFILDNLKDFQEENHLENVWMNIKNRLEEYDLLDFMQNNIDAFNSENPNRGLWLLIKEKLDDNNLSSTIDKNREKFDDFEPQKDLWEKIESGLEKHEETKLKVTSRNSEPKMVPIKVVWQVAASFLVIIMTIIGFQFIENTLSDLKFSQSKSSEINLSEISPDLYEAEIYYTSLIEKSQNQISKYDLKKLGLETGFGNDIDHLDSMYSQMKDDLVESQGSEKVISALVENLQLRIEILRRQLEIIEQIERYRNNEKSEQDEIKI